MVKIKQKLVLLYLALFPLGVLPGFFIRQIFDLPFNLHLTDLIVITIALFSLQKTKFNLLFAYLFTILLVSTSALTPYLYLIRLTSHFLFFLYLIKQKLDSKYLVIISLSIAIFGWLQYIFLPDLTALKYFGWDDHLNRLVGTFLDPAFTGLFLGLGTILTLQAKIKNKIPISLFLILTLTFTYSRASILSLSIALIYLFLQTKNKLNLKLVITILIFTVFLPIKPGEGTNLIRTASINARLVNYQTSLQTFVNSPLIGHGYNTLDKSIDNSFIFLLSTFGTIGTLLLADALFKQSKNLKLQLLTPSLILISTHALFSNSLFYSFTLGWLAILGAISYRKR